MLLFRKWAFVYRNHPYPTLRLSMTSLSNPKYFSKTYAKLYASVYQLNNLLWLKSNCLWTQRTRLHLSAATEKKPSKQYSFLHINSFFCWIGSYVVEKPLPNNNYMVRKIAKDKTLVLHCMRLRPFVPLEPIPNVQTKSRDRKPDPEVINSYDDSYAKAWEPTFWKPTFDDDQDEPSSSNPHKKTRGANYANAETCSTRGTKFPRRTDFITERIRITKGTLKWNWVHSNWNWTLLIQEVLKKIYFVFPKSNSNDSYWYWIADLSYYIPRNAYVHYLKILRICYGTDKYQLQIFFLVICEHSLATNSLTVFSQLLEKQDWCNWFQEIIFDADSRLFYRLKINY